jgi:hypothetical protein
MSQLVALKTTEHMIIASDRRVEIRDGDNARASHHRKLFALGANAAITSVGAAIGIAISKKLSASIRQTISLTFKDLESFVLQVFQEEYDNFISRGTAWFADNPEAHRRASFALGAKDPDGLFSLAFYVSEDHDQPFRKAPLLDASVVMPRRLGLEAKLARETECSSSLHNLKEITLQSLQQIEALDLAVGSPFDFALFDKSGMRIEESA